MAVGSAPVAFTTCDGFSPEFLPIPQSVFPVVNRMTAGLNQTDFASMISHPDFEKILLSAQMVVSETVAADNDAVGGSAALDPRARIKNDLMFTFWVNALQALAVCG